MAPVHYFRTPSNQPIGPDVPPAKGEQVEGLIQALLIEDEEGQASVVFPGGEMARVDMDQVRRESPEAISHVPI